MINYKRILISTTKSELSTTHAGSVAGVLWIALSPIILMSIYSVIYLLIFRIRPVEMSSGTYVLYIFTGLIPFLGFSAALISGTTSLTANKEVLLNTVFPAELVPLRAVLTGMVPTVAGLAVLTIVAFFLGHLNIMMLTIPIILLLLIMFVSGVVWILSLMNIVMRDIQFILTFVTMALLIVSPIAYTESMVPSSLKSIIYFNPLSYYIMALHDVIVFEKIPSIRILLGIFGFSLFSFSFGFFVFQKAKKVFFDYV